MNRSKHIKEWMQKAEQDYQTIIILSRQRKNLLPDIICFHAHQCAEKYLKGLLEKYHIKSPKTHDLIFLTDKLTEIDPDLELIKDVLRELNRYAIELRYPGESATKAESKKAIINIKHIRKILLEKLA